MKPHFKSSTFLFYKIKCGPFDNNAYVLVCRETNQSILIDTPADPNVFIAIAESTKVNRILITHSHSDHIAGFDEVINTFKVPVNISKYDSNALNYDLLDDLKDDSKISFGNLNLQVLFTPGHTAGSTCFYLDGHLFSGDTLFPGGPGKTQSEEKLNQIIDSITGKLFVLPASTIFYPGHGDDGELSVSISEYEIYKSKNVHSQTFGDIFWLKS
ncbi:MAG: MBL fold metallo-hydrolase [SAR202 cluster bacterium]|nr:MBL fold metallo-hydrolase [SAR202 cluster bacterium]